MNQAEKKELSNLTLKVGVIEERQLQHSVIQKEIQDSQESTEKKVDSLLFYITGDEQTHTKGLVEKQEKYEGRLNRLERVYLAVGLFLGLLMAFKNIIIDWITKP